MNHSIGYTLATRGIPSDVDYDDVSGDYEPDPWRPRPKRDVICITIEAADESKLVDLLSITEEE